jgi:hypothetical protein
LLVPLLALLRLVRLPLPRELLSLQPAPRVLPLLLLLALLVLLLVSVLVSDSFVLYLHIILWLCVPHILHTFHVIFTSS